MNFRTTLRLHGTTATGIEVPETVIEALGGGGRVLVRATVAGQTYPTTIVCMRGTFLFPVSAEVRERAGVAAGDAVEVPLERERAARQAFDGLSCSNKKRHVLSVEGAKTPETRERRIGTVLDELTASR